MKLISLENSWYFFKKIEIEENHYVKKTNTIKYKL